MEKLPGLNIGQLMTNGTASTPSLPRPSVERQEAVKPVVREMFSGFPDYGKAPAPYLMAILEFVAGLNDDEIAHLMHPRTGVAARCNFLPTKADMVKILNEAEAVASKFRASTDNRHLKRDTRPYEPKQVPQFFDRHGNRITEAEAQARAAEHRVNVESMKRVERVTAYARMLGNGDGMAGWQIMVERGISEPPEDWQPEEKTA